MFDMQAMTQFSNQDSDTAMQNDNKLMQQSVVYPHFLTITATFSKCRNKKEKEKKVHIQNIRKTKGQSKKDRE